ncbi:MAG TPA: hypothetical protein PLX14_07985 [Anaerolineales bacterium]|nr:hypothetical protein [Anaerolineales bacterium]HNC08629.1 hypothetical protein [Anaerolineales bacterium]
MKIVKNEKLIKRNSTIAQWTSLGALIVLGGGMYISFTKPEWITYSLICLAVGFIMTQVGMYMGNRWGRSPRPDEKLEAGLKGLTNEFNLYHYTSPVSHLLVGPSGVFVLLPYHQTGEVFFEKNRWKIRGGGFMQMYMRVFGQEGLGRPDLEAESEIATMKKFFAKQIDQTAVPEIKPVIVFTSDKVEVEAGESPIPAMKLKHLKDFIRKGAKPSALSHIQIQQITALFAKE